MVSVRGSRIFVQNGKKVHGVMVCRNCYSADRHPLHWHRDINAARNVVAIYQHLAGERLRPTFSYFFYVVVRHQRKGYWRREVLSYLQVCL